MERIFGKVENNIIVNSIRRGLVMAMPILLIGSMVIVLNTFAKALLEQFPELVFLKSFSYMMVVIHGATFGVLSIYLVSFISISYMKQYRNHDVPEYGAFMVSTAGFIILSGGFTRYFELSSLGFQGLFTAIVSTSVAVPLYCRLSKNRITKKFYTEGVNVYFKNALACIFPLLVIVILFGMFNLLLENFWGIHNFQELFTRSSNILFKNMGRSLASSMLFVFLSSLLWFFGIHGGNVLDNISETLFRPAVDINLQQIQAGQVPTEIFNKTFFDVFVFMGGCGSLMCLLIAILLFSKRQNSRYLGKVSAITMAFNVNELFVFGLPVVFNLSFFIPFLLTPLVFILTSTAAVKMGIVPVAAYSVEWIMPIFFNGYKATGSWAGVILQIFNLGLGVLIYYPFLKIYDRIQLERSKKNMKELVGLLQENEENNVQMTLIEQSFYLGSVAKIVASDLKRGFAKNELKMYYQPQYDDTDTCVGAEALLRWNHSLYGMVYPPLVVKLADEMGILKELEKYIFRAVAKDMVSFEKDYGKPIKFSVNVSAKTIQDDDFELFLKKLKKEYHIKDKSLCIEITEQMSLRMDQKLEEKFKRIRRIGYLLAIDDFSMGNTSLKYLQSNQFDIVKLDGSLVKDLIKNENSKEIIGSIISLSKSLGFDVVAEYVETAQMRDGLKNIGCKIYQGYYYQKAIPYDEFCSFLKGKDT